MSMWLLPSLIIPNFETLRWRWRYGPVVDVTAGASMGRIRMATRRPAPSLNVNVSQMSTSCWFKALLQLTGCLVSCSRALQLFGLTAGEALLTHFTHRFWCIGNTSTWHMYGEVGRGLKSRSRWMDCDKERGKTQRHEEEDSLSENHKNTPKSTCLGRYG